MNYDLNSPSAHRSGALSTPLTDTTPYGEALVSGYFSDGSIYMTNQMTVYPEIDGTRDYAVFALERCGPGRPADGDGSGGDASGCPRE